MGKRFFFLKHRRSEVVYEIHRIIKFCLNDKKVTLYIEILYNQLK